MENPEVQNPAEQIARLLQQKSSDELLRSTLENINARLTAIESRTAISNPQFATEIPKIIHASQEKFTNLEDFADEIIGSLQAEKVCPYEPTGKLCDNCSMCNSRGF